MFAVRIRLVLLVTTSLLFILGQGAIHAAPYYETVLDDNPLGYWRLGEAAGASQAVDASGSGRDLNYNNMTPAGFAQPGAIVGDPDTAVQFIPATNNPTISSPNTADFGFASGQSFSAEYWIKALPGNATATDAGLLVKGYDSSQAQPWYLSRYKSGGYVDFFLRSPDKSVTSTTAVNDGQWHHVVGVYDSGAGQIRMFVDGQLEATNGGVGVNSYGTNSRPFTIANHLNRNVDASMDEIAMYGTALGDLQVLDHYRAGIGVPALNVDFGSNPTSGGGPGGRQPGFYEFEDTEGGGTPPVIRTYDLLGGDGTVDVKIGGYTHFRDYAAVTGTYAGQSELLSDMVLRNADGTMKLTLDGLAAGTYEITTYHHSTQFGGGALDIRLFDAAAPGQVVATGVPVSSGTNPSSISTQTFQFTAGGSSVVIDLLGGTTSQHMPLNGFELELIAPAKPVYKTDVLAIDFNDRGNSGAAYTQDGFQEYLLTDNSGGTQSYGSIDVTLSQANAGILDDRHRNNPTDGGAFTQQELLRDFVFGAADPDAPDDGLDVLIEGLEPDARYEVTLWSFDDGSPDNRISDWFANGDLVMNDYVFNGNYAPLSDGVYQFRFLADADAQGDLLLAGRESGGGSPNVFLNALALSRVRPVPEPSTFALAILGLAGLGLAVRRRRRRT